MEFYERVSGARLHAALFPAWCVAYDIPEGLLLDIKQLCRNTLLIEFPDMEELLSNNRVWRARLTDCWCCRFLALFYNMGLLGVIASKYRFPWGFTVSICHMKYMTSLILYWPLEHAAICYDRYLVRYRRNAPIIKYHKTVY